MFEERGWIVLRIWECELKKKNEKALMMRIGTYFRGDINNTSYAIQSAKED